MGGQSVEAVKGVYEAFGRSDVPGVLGAFADEIEWYEAEGMPWGLHRGGEAVAQKVFCPDRRRSREFRRYTQGVQGIR